MSRIEDLEVIGGYTVDVLAPEKIDPSKHKALVAMSDPEKGDAVEDGLRKLGYSVDRCHNPEPPDPLCIAVNSRYKSCPYPEGADILIRDPADKNEDGTNRFNCDDCMTPE